MELGSLVNLDRAFCAWCDVCRLVAGCGDASQMPGDVKKMTAMTKKEALSMLATGQEDEMVDLVVNAFEEYKAITSPLVPRHDCGLESGLKCLLVREKWRCSKYLQVPPTLERTYFYVPMHFRLKEVNCTIHLLRRCIPTHPPPC